MRGGAVHACFRAASWQAGGARQRRSRSERASDGCSLQVVGGVKSRARARATAVHAWFWFDHRRCPWRSVGTRHGTPEGEGTLTETVRKKKIIYSTGQPSAASEIVLQEDIGIRHQFTDHAGTHWRSAAHLKLVRDQISGLSVA